MYAVQWHSVKDNKPKPYAQSWDELVSLLSDHVERADKYDGYLYSPVTYVENARRGNNNVIGINAFVADLDGEALNDTLKKLDGYEFITYTTYSHTEQSQHWHIVIPLSEQVASHEWLSVWEQMHEFLGITGDPQTCDPARIYFAPQHAPNAVHKTIRGTGKFLTPPPARFADRAPVNPTKRDERDESYLVGCSCTLDKVCKRCAKQFEGIDLTGYNGMSQKEIRQAIRREFLEIMAMHNAN